MFMKCLYEAKKTPPRTLPPKKLLRSECSRTPQNLENRRTRLRTKTRRSFTSPRNSWIKTRDEKNAAGSVCHTSAHLSLSASLSHSLCALEEEGSTRPERRRLRSGASGFRQRQLRHRAGDASNCRRPMKTSLTPVSKNVDHKSNPVAPESRDTSSTASESEAFLQHQLRDHRCPESVQAFTHLHH